jgi:hypothetical protein
MIAAEITEDLRAALEQFQERQTDLRTGLGDATAWRVGDDL